MDISRIKQSGKAAFKANYIRCVAVAFALKILTMGTTVVTGRNFQSAGDAMAEQELGGALQAMPAGQQATFAGIFLGAISLVLVVSILLRIFIFNPLQVGAYRFFRKNAEGAPARAGVVEEGFGAYGHTFATLFLRDLFLCLWTALFIIPGIIKAYSYMLVPYIIKDEPELSALETISRSKELMRGHKMEAFLMDLSFIGWFLLGFVTCNLANIFWTNPYHESARAEFYLTLLGE